MLHLYVFCLGAVSAAQLDFEAFLLHLKIGDGVFLHQVDNTFNVFKFHDGKSVLWAGALGCSLLFGKTNRRASTSNNVNDAEASPGLVRGQGSFPVRGAFPRDASMLELLTPCR